MRSVSTKEGVMLADLPTMQTTKNPGQLAGACGVIGIS